LRRLAPDGEQALYPPDIAGNKVMRAETQAVVDSIEQSLELLRRHL
jgi:hypothetical protein